MWIQVGDTTYNTDALAYVRRDEIVGLPAVIIVCPANSPARRFNEEEAAHLMDFLAFETALARNRLTYEMRDVEKNDVALCKLINDFQDKWEGTK